MTLTIGPLTKLGLLFPVVCTFCVCVFDQTLVERPYHDKVTITISWKCDETQSDSQNTPSEGSVFAKSWGPQGL